MKVDVIIPVGPGHMPSLQAAVESVAVASEHDQGPFREIGIRAIDDGKGEMGRSAARNTAVAQSDADWVYYLDADDMVMPEVFSSVFGYTREYAGVWGQFGEIDQLRVTERYQVREIEGIEKLLRFNPQHTIKIGHFCRRDVALRYPFNEDMDTGEDWEYYLRMWENEKCIKLGGPLTYVKSRGQHSTGPRSATGADWSASVLEQFRKARERHGIS